MKNKLIKMTLTASMAVMSLLPQYVNAHFVWIGKDIKTGETKIYFGEGPEPDQKAFLKGISKINLWEHVDGNFAKVGYAEESDGENGWLRCNSKRNSNEVIGDVAYGLFSRGESSMFLHYSGKHGQLKKNSSLSKKSCSILPLDVVAETIGKEIVLSATFQSKASANCDLTIIDPAGNSIEQLTDKSGKTTVPAKSGRYLIRAKHIDGTAGKHEGKPFSETRYYCTLVLDVNLAKKSEDSKTAGTKDVNTKRLSAPEDFASAKRIAIANIPQGVTSFGGAIANDKIFIYGGHTGKPHSYYESGQNDKLYEIDLANPSEWRVAGEGPGLQGLAMVAHQNKLYRLGGFHAHNKEGEKHDLRSVKDFAVFDASSKSWTQLEPMPHGRSSFDAVVLKGVIYVVGGWEMKGKNGTQWCETALSFDLNAKNSKWQKLPNPSFKRRALSVGFQENKLIAVGGMQKEGGPTKKVGIYDLSTKVWTDGPELPGEGRMEGFGTSCFNVGGELIVSTYGGNICNLNSDFSKWEIIFTCDEGRFFHRLLPLNENDFVLVGGASMESGKFYNVEVHSKK